MSKLVNVSTDTVTVWTAIGWRDDAETPAERALLDIFDEALAKMTPKQRAKALRGVDRILARSKRNAAKAKR